MISHLSSALALAACLSASLPAVGWAADPLAGTQGRDRVLLVLAARPDDPNLARQRTLFARMEAGARERDLRLIEVVGDAASASTQRGRFALPPTGFRALLIGKDGGGKLSSDAPLDAGTLFPTIDAMPMRQDEMRRRS